MELFAIALAGTGEFIWAKVTDRAHAEQVAVTAAVNHGNVNLLSGLDLAAWITDWEGP